MITWEDAEVAYFVFISHSSADAWTASRIERDIAALGAETFLCEIEVAGGDDFGESMKTAMSTAQECLVLYTPEAAQSRNVWIEIGGAWMMGRRVVLVLSRITTSEITGDPRFPPYLKSLDFVDLNGQFDSRYLNELRSRVGQHGSP